MRAEHPISQVECSEFGVIGTETVRAKITNAEIAFVAPGPVPMPPPP